MSAKAGPTPAPAPAHRTLDQRRAASAWDAIDQVRALDKTTRTDLVRAARKLPVRIITAGLGHALQFVKAKNKAPLLLERISAWVLVDRPRPATTPIAPAAAKLAAGQKPGQKGPPPARPAALQPAAPQPAAVPATPDAPDLLARIRIGSSDELRRHTAETLAWLAWFNRFAEAEFPREYKSTEQGEDDAGS